jgi:hypothetical protein
MMEAQLMSLNPKIFFGCAAFILLSCGQTQMVNTTGMIRQQMMAGNYNAALSTLRQSKNEGFKEQDRVVYWMNEGMLLYLVGQYQDSVNVLNLAERRSKELYTKSISKGITAAFTSEAATDYEGEDYEKVLLNVLKALDFLALKETDEALVEARMINEKLKLFNTRYGNKNVYNQDAFAHWMMGLLFEMEGSYDDARIAYVKALEVYQQDYAANYGIGIPSFLGEDIVRASLLSHSSEDVEKYRQMLGAGLGRTVDEIKSKGEVIFINLNGEGPSKSDFVVTCWFLDAARWACDAEPGGKYMKKTTIVVPPQGTVIKVAFPELHVTEPRNTHLTLTASGQTIQTSAVEPINGIAAKVLADKMQIIFRDAMIRVITKTLSSKGAGAVAEKAVGGEAGKFLGFLTERGSSAVMQAYEEADKRAWMTLPAQIEVARFWLPPGTHTIGVQSAHGFATMIPHVKVEAGKRVFIGYRTLP